MILGGQTTAVLSRARPPHLRKQAGGVTDTVEGADMESVPTKACSKCGGAFPLSAFGKRSASWDGLEQRCRPCTVAAARAWALRNPDRVKRNYARWAAENKDRVAATSRAYYVSHPRDRQRLAQNAQRYYWKDVEQKRERKRIAQLLRQARKASAPLFVILDKDFRRLMQGVCAVRGCSNMDIQLDHIIPIARGGSHGIGNLQPLCGVHNRSKGARTWMEFRMYLARTQSR